MKLMTKYLFKILASFSFLIFFSFSSNAQVVDTRLDGKRINIGDIMTFSYNIPIGKISGELSKPSFVSEDTLELVGQKYDTIVKDGKKIIEIKYFLTSFVPGNHSIKMNNAKEQYFEVLSYPIDTNKILIKDIKANAKEPITIKEIMPIIIAILLVVAVIFASIYFYKLWEKNRGLNIKDIFSKPEIVLPAHILALNRFEELRLKRLCQNGRNKEYYSELSDILREYLFNRFNLTAIEMTTDEILSSINSFEGIDDNSIVLLDYVLKNSDFVKFAKYIPNNFIDDRCLQNAISFVSNTKPVENIERGKEVANV